MIKPKRHLYPAGTSKHINNWRDERWILINTLPFLFCLSLLPKILKDQIWVSNHGRVYNATTRKLNGKGKRRVRKLITMRLNDGREIDRYNYQLTAMAFCPNRRRRQCVHHIDDKFWNNRYQNLLWVTKAEHQLLHNYLDRGMMAEYWQLVALIYSDSQLVSDTNLVYDDENDNTNQASYVYDVTNKGMRIIEAGGTLDDAINEIQGQYILDTGCRILDELKSA
mgnify:CR=1 FL=1